MANRAVDPAFGTNAELDPGLHATTDGPPGYLVLEGVFNHTGDWNSGLGRETYGSLVCPVSGANPSPTRPYCRWRMFQSWPIRYANFPDLLPTPPKLNCTARRSRARQQIHAATNFLVQPT